MRGDRIPYRPREVVKRSEFDKSYEVKVVSLEDFRDIRVLSKFKYSIVTVKTA